MAEHWTKDIDRNIRGRKCDSDDFALTVTRWMHDETGDWVAVSYQGLDSGSGYYQVTMNGFGDGETANTRKAAESIAKRMMA